MRSLRASRQRRNNNDWPPGDDHPSLVASRVPPIESDARRSLADSSSHIYIPNSPTVPNGRRRPRTNDTVYTTLRAVTQSRRADRRAENMVPAERSASCRWPAAAAKAPAAPRWITVPDSRA